MNNLALMLLADARLPVGGHVSSAGLEPALLGTLPTDQIPAYIGTRLRTATLVDAATAVLARGGHDLAPIAGAWAARTPSPVSRQVAQTLGRGIQRLLTRLWPEHPATASLAGATVPWRPLAVGALAAAAGLDAMETALLVCHDDVAAIAAAALKLAPRDPVETTGWLLAAHPLMTEVAVRAAAVTSPEDIPASSAPLAECWTQWHAHNERRLFLA